jgi:hypothetical protein
VEKRKGRLKDIVTDYDNETYDTGRVLAVSVVLSMLVMQGWSVWKSGTFDPAAFGTGVAAVIAALGVAIFGDNAKRPKNDRVTTSSTGDAPEAGAEAGATNPAPPVSG